MIIVGLVSAWKSVDTGDGKVLEFDNVLVNSNDRWNKQYFSSYFKCFIIVSVFEKILLFHFIKTNKNRRTFKKKCTIFFCAQTFIYQTVLNFGDLINLPQSVVSPRRLHNKLGMS